jgi:hypothetical protein
VPGGGPAELIEQPRHRGPEVRGAQGVQFGQGHAIAEPGAQHSDDVVV